MHLWIAGVVLLLGAGALVFCVGRYAADGPPGWLVRLWLPVAEALLLLVIAGPVPPSLFWWAVAGPWTANRFDGLPVAVAATLCVVLVAGMLLYSFRPGLPTAVLSLASFFAWVVLGYGVITASV